MNKTSETLFYVLLTVLFFAISVYFLSSGLEYFILIPFMIYALLIIYVKRNKKIISYVKNDFMKLGYELISERALKSSERKIKIEPAILTIGNTPIKKYKNKYNRVFTAKSKKGKLFELNTCVTENKDETLEIVIIEKKKLS